MSRLCCIDIPSFDLQLLLRNEPTWAHEPVAIIEEDRPNALVLEQTRAAQKAGVRRGMRYAEALSLVPSLRAHVPCAQARHVVWQSVAQRLSAYSPIVEEGRAWGAVLWLQGRGLASLWPSASAWTEAIAVELASMGLRVSLVCGFERMNTLAVARQRRLQTTVFRSGHDERAAADTVSLDMLGLRPGLHNEFSLLGLKDVGALRSLATGAVQLRYGEEAAAFLRHWQGITHVLPPVWTPPAAYVLRVDIEDGVRATDRLLFLMAPLIEDLCSAVAQHAQVANALTLTLEMDWPARHDPSFAFGIDEGDVRVGEALEVTLRPAEATVETGVWMDLFRLRFERLRLPVAAVAITLEATCEAEDPVQQEMGIGGKEQREWPLLRALARVRAELGDDAVGILQQQPAHLPEARQRRQPCTTLAAPQPLAAYQPRLCRRMLPLVQRIEAEPGKMPRDWLPLLKSEGRATRMIGPYVVSGAWWHREVDRAYYFVHIERGDVLWVYHDRARDAWTLQAFVH